jgi:hypothetical protein
MTPENVKALANDFETVWRDEFAVIPDDLVQLVRDLFVALDELNNYNISDRRLTWVDVSFTQVGRDWKAFATPRVDIRKWNGDQSIQLIRALEGFNRAAIV